VRSPSQPSTYVVPAGKKPSPLPHRFISPGGGRSPSCRPAVADIAQSPATYRQSSRASSPASAGLDHHSAAHCRHKTGAALPLLDEAIEWTEDHVHFFGMAVRPAQKQRSPQGAALLAGLTDEELADFAALGSREPIRPGIVSRGGEQASSCSSCRAHGQRETAKRRAPSQARSGMEFGEMALLDEQRTPIFGPTPMCVSRMPIRIHRFRQEHPHIAERIAAISPTSSQAPDSSNAKIDLLSAY